METKSHKEEFLHFLWKFQLFNAPLETAEGKNIMVINPGFHNNNEGPDFLEAKIKIEDILWSGSIEIHLKSSDWLVHNHTTNSAYDNTILHVVWQNNQEIFNDEGNPIPTLEIKNLVDHQLIEKYRNLVASAQEDKLPCSFALADIPKIKKESMVQRVLLERIEQKVNRIADSPPNLSDEWDELAYRLLLKAFGFKVNEEPFQALSYQLPFKILKKYINDKTDLEALLFGVAGFLNQNPIDDYQKSLSDNYLFLKQKHSLSEIPHHWKKLRTRPSNFPCVRLSQLAAALYKSPEIFNKLLSLNQIQAIKSVFSHPVSGYWHLHIDFGVENTKFSHSIIGQDSIHNLIINVVAPLKIYFGKWRHADEWVENGLNLLETVPAEKNKFVTIMKNNGFEAKNASQSQGLLHLHHHYCEKKKCLNCAIGNHILTKTDANH